MNAMSLASLNPSYGLRDYGKNGKVNPK